MTYIDDNLQLIDIGEAMTRLSAQRREQAMRYSYDLGQRTCIAAYMLLCSALQTEYGIAALPEFGYGEHGKPYIIGHEDIHFNFSHCREAVVCSVADRPIGVDVESLRQPRQSLIDYTMNAREAALIRAAADPGRLFTQLWTMKESLLKLAGTGITDNIRDVLGRDDVRFTTVFTPRYIYTLCQYKE